MNPTQDSDDVLFADLQEWKDSGRIFTFDQRNSGSDGSSGGDGDELPIFFQHEDRHGGLAPPLLRIHGFPTASWDFRDLWPELTARFNVVAHDLVGLGLSAKPKQPITQFLQADVIEALLKHLGIEEAHILAHDLGDTVAQELLARQLDGVSPIRWLSCTFLNGGLFPESHKPRFIQKVLLSPLGPLVARLMPEFRFRRSLSAVFGPDTQPSDAFLKDAWHLLIVNGGRAALPRVIQYMKERRAHRERWIRPLLENVVPMRLIDGALDPVSGRHLADRYAELVPDADVVMLDHLGHYPHVEEPDAVLRPFLEFIEPLTGLSTEPD